MKALLKLLFVDSLVNILGDLFEQPLIMWAFIGWGWLSILVMVTSIYQTMGQLFRPCRYEEPFGSIAIYSVITTMITTGLRVLRPSRSGSALILAGLS
jgi:hypothetical protein